MATKKENETENIDELISDFSRFYILTILYEGPAHGYQILSRFKKRVKKEVSPSLVYPFLQHLEDKGLVKHELKPVGEKEKKKPFLEFAGTWKGDDADKVLAQLMKDREHAKTREFEL